MTGIVIAPWSARPPGPQRAFQSVQHRAHHLVAAASAILSIIPLSPRWRRQPDNVHPRCAARPSRVTWRLSTEPRGKRGFRCGNCAFFPAPPVSATDQCRRGMVCRAAQWNRGSGRKDSVTTRNRMEKKHESRFHRARHDGQGHGGQSAKGRPSAHRPRPQPRRGRAVSGEGRGLGQFAARRSPRRARWCSPRCPSRPMSRRWRSGPTASSRA